MTLTSMYFKTDSLTISGVFQDYYMLMFYSFNVNMTVQSTIYNSHLKADNPTNVSFLPISTELT